MRPRLSSLTALPCDSLPHLLFWQRLTLKHIHNKQGKVHQATPTMDPLRRIAVQEDMVQYCLFLVQPNLSDTQADELHLQQLVEEILAKVAPLLMQYIWQQQPFNLKYHTEKGGVPAHIGGSAVFGDSVEDEWFIVYLLFQITQAFPELAARGELYILPCPSRCSGDGLPRDAVPSVTQALALLSSHTHACLASPKNRTALEKRLEGYPEKIQANLHHAHCFLPAGIATVLAQRPDLVAPAVSSFYLRDPVTFTRCLYAQIQQQHFTPDRRSGFTLPARSHPLYRAQELGMKLAHGFEILCSNLKKNGYLKGELQGSAYCRVLLQAVSHPNTQLRWQGPR
ncbi:hypothetical protein J4Q44_G00360080 [Coregonus suidteri]|uniref:Uncharacterized protein n=1 Tax=Coregonus suidteri TaxID=861788 RepID=A0AAN8KLK2_9TELE